MSRGWLCTTVIAASIASAANAQTFTQKADAAAFDRGDREARELISVLDCARAAGQARSEGALGPVDSLGRAHQCIRVHDRWAIVFADVDTSFRSAQNVRAFDLGSRSRLAEGVDTAAVIALERAELTAQRRGANDYRTARRRYTPLSMRFEGDTIEVWLLPISLILGEERTVGGERGYVFSPDGKQVVREIDSFADYRPIAIPDSGEIRIVSSRTLIPSLSELLLANLFHDRGRQVAIITSKQTSTLVAARGGDLWIQIPHK